jgi:hypothetical protein
MPKIDMDQLYSTSRDKAAFVVFSALDAIQEQRSHVQVVAVSLLFCAFCERLGLSARDMHSMAERILREEDFHHKANSQLQALREFAGLRLSDPKHGSDDATIHKAGV